MSSTPAVDRGRDLPFRIPGGSGTGAATPVQHHSQHLHPGVRSMTPSGVRVPVPAFSGSPAFGEPPRPRRAVARVARTAWAWVALVLAPAMATGATFQRLQLDVIDVAGTPLDARVSARSDSFFTYHPSAI